MIILISMTMSPLFVDQVPPSSADLIVRPNLWNTWPGFCDAVNSDPTFLFESSVTQKTQKERRTGFPGLGEREEKELESL